tara:strand:- start:521 stop:808 length:288 start_codon:yes stop_codon:yes gene_type:complete
MSPTFRGERLPTARNSSGVVLLLPSALDLGLGRFANARQSLDISPRLLCSKILGMIPVLASSKLFRSLLVDDCDRGTGVLELIDFKFEEFFLVFA